MKKLFISIIIIALLVIGAYFLLPSSKTQNLPVGEEEVEQLFMIIDKSLVLEKTYKEPTAYTVFDVSYPEFKNVSPDFNKKIEDFVQEGIARHKKDSADNWKARYDTQSPGEKISEFPPNDEKFQFSITWEPTQINKNFVSVLMVISGYTGGAHGYQNMISWNYDVLNKKEMTLKDLFPSNPNFLKTVSEFSRKDLVVQFKKKLNIKTKEEEANFKESSLPMLEGGTTPEEINFSIFTFDAESIMLYFTQYQVAPYSMGGSVVTMPRK